MCAGHFRPAHFFIWRIGASLNSMFNVLKLTNIEHSTSNARQLRKFP